MSEIDRADRLDRDELQLSLGRNADITIVQEAASTNDLMWKKLERGAHAGSAIFAECQTAGRGQYGRRWESTPYKGLWFSMLLRPPITIDESPKLTGLLAAAIAETICTETGCVATIKPPNDIYIGGRKVAGVLVEGRIEANGHYVAVAGIGINVNQDASDFPEELRATAGSLAMATGRKIQRLGLASALLTRLDEECARPFTA